VNATYGFLILCVLASFPHSIPHALRPVPTRNHDGIGNLSRWYSFVGNPSLSTFSIDPKSPKNDSIKLPLCSPQRSTSPFHPRPSKTTKKYTSRSQQPNYPFHPLHVPLYRGGKQDCSTAFFTGLYHSPPSCPPLPLSSCPGLTRIGVRNSLSRRTASYLSTMGGSETPCLAIECRSRIACLLGPNRPKVPSLLASDDAIDLKVKVQEL
jgi:hypothetical protein